MRIFKLTALYALLDIVEEPQDAVLIAKLEKKKRVYSAVQELIHHSCLQNGGSDAEILAEQRAAVSFYTQLPDSADFKKDLEEHQHSPYILGGGLPMNVGAGYQQRSGCGDKPPGCTRCGRPYRAAYLDRRKFRRRG
jgi:hypothetical protein